MLGVCTRDEGGGGRSVEEMRFVREATEEERERSEGRDGVDGVGG